MWPHDNRKLLVAWTETKAQIIWRSYLGFSLCLSVTDTWNVIVQTFEAKLLHIESRPGRKSKNGAADLDFFMRCEVHSSDLDVFINSLKRVADDVRSVPDEKGKQTPTITHTSTSAAWLTTLCEQNYGNLHSPTKAIIISFLPDGSSLVSPTDKRAGQMQHADHQIWSGHGPGAPSECLLLKWLNELFSYIVCSALTTSSAGIPRPGVQEEACLHLRAGLQIQTVGLTQRASLVPTLLGLILKSLFSA